VVASGGKFHSREACKILPMQITETDARTHGEIESRVSWPSGSWPDCSNYSSARGRRPPLWNAKVMGSILTALDGATPRRVIKDLILAVKVSGLEYLPW